MTALAFARQGYESAAAGWANGAELVYGPLADALLARAPDRAGRVVLDLGAGTGAVSHRLVAAGAHVVAVDASWPMLAHRAASRPPGVVGDIARLPLLDSAVDGAAAAFVLNHLADPVAALSRGASCLAQGRIRRRIGVLYRRPASRQSRHRRRDGRRWMEAAGVVPDILKSVDAKLGSAALMHTAAESAGLEHIDVVERPVPTGVTDPRDVVRYRLSQPQFAGFMAGLDDPTRRQVVDSALPRWPPPARPSPPGSCSWPLVPEGIGEPPCGLCPGTLPLLMLLSAAAAARRPASQSDGSGVCVPAPPTG